MQTFKKDLQYYKFCLYGFLKNLKFFEPFLILFFVDKNISFIQIGTLYAIREISTNILEIPTGIVADIFGRRRSMIFSFIAYIFSFILFYFSATYGLFVIAMLLFSFGEAFRTGTHKALIFEYLSIKGWKDQKVYYYGHTRSWSQIGTAISSLIGAFIVFYTGVYKLIFLFSTIPYLLDLINLLSYPKQLDGELQDFKVGKLKQTIVTVIKEFVLSWKNPGMIRVILNTSIPTGFNKGIKDYLQPVLYTFAIGLPIALAITEKQKASFVIGIIYFIIYIVTSIAARKSGSLADRFNHTAIPLNLTMVAMFATGILIGLFFKLELAAVSISLFLIMLLLENVRKPIGIAHISDMSKQNILASSLSAASQVQSIATAVTAIMIGFFVEYFGVGIGLLVSSVVMLLFSSLYLVKRKHKTTLP